MEPSFDELDGEERLNRIILLLDSREGPSINDVHTDAKADNSTGTVGCVSVTVRRGQGVKRSHKFWF